MKVIICLVILMLLPVSMRAQEYDCLSFSDCLYQKDRADSLEGELEWCKGEPFYRILATNHLIDSILILQSVVDSLNNLIKMPYTVETFIDGSFDTTFLPKPCDCPEVFYVDTVWKEEYSHEATIFPYKSPYNDEHRRLVRTFKLIVNRIDTTYLTTGTFQVDKPRGE